VSNVSPHITAMISKVDSKFPSAVENCKKAVKSSDTFVLMSAAARHPAETVFS
jgi:hypothetical protein